MVLAKLFDPAAGRQRLDRYELMGEIASGGMATVYLARLTGVGGFQRFVAVKRLHPHLAQEGEFVEMFLDEARIAARIHHPNVVPILEVGASAIGYYLVMEYVEGDTLARLLARASMRHKRLPPPIALRVALDTLSGLHAAHELRDDAGEAVNLVHRDVSPQNVLVGMDGIARITDFGVARAASRLSATRVGQLKGKIAYMAPEQAAGDERIDRRADVFSAGIVIWETLAAKRLFKAENEAATLSRVMTTPIPVLHEVASGISKEVSAVVMRALDRNPDRRHMTCAQFADALEAAAEGRDRIASPRELAAYVTEAMGEEIAGQREAVRAWLARSEVSQHAPAPLPPGANPASSVSAAAMSLPGLGSDPTASQVSLSSSIARPRSRVPLLIAATLVFGLVGAGAYALTRAVRAPAPLQAAAPPAPQAAPPEAVPSPVEPPAAPVEAAPSASAGAAAAPAPEEAAAKPGPSPRPAAPARAKPAKKKASDDVDLRNPYR